MISNTVKSELELFLKRSHIINDVFAACDVMFSNFSGYLLIKDEIKNSLDDIIILTACDLKLINRIRNKFMTDDSITMCIVSHLNEPYKSVISECMMDIKNYIKFELMYQNTQYPPIFFTSDAVICLNKLFNKIYLKQISFDEFKNNIQELFMNKVNYLYRIFENGIQAAFDNGVDVLYELYEYCTYNKNELILKSDYMIENCMTNPSSKYFLQVTDECTHRDQITFVEANIYGLQYNINNSKRIVSHIKDLIQIMMRYIYLKKETFLQVITDIYNTIVTNPIDMDLLNYYILAFYEFIHRNIEN